MVVSRVGISPLLVLLVALLAFLLVERAAVPEGQSGFGSGAGVSLKGLDLPLSFQANHGQTDESVAFFARASGFDVFAASSGPVLALPSADGTAGVAIDLIGADPAPVMRGTDQLPGTVNYFIGEDPSGWLTGIPTYGGVVYEEVYPGIDLSVYGNQAGELEYDFIVAPGADQSIIQMQFDGVRSVALQEDGSLMLTVAGGKIVQRPPVVYQEIDGRRVAVDGRYVLNGETVGFKVGAYDASLPLVIDPVLVWGSFLGGALRDDAHGVATDDDGNVYVIGQTQSTNFPVTPGVYSGVFTGQTNQPDVFVTKINPDGTDILYSTYIGGEGGDVGYDIEVDNAGQAFIVGTADSGFPVTGGVFSTDGGGFVAKLSADGSELIYSTKLGTNTEVYGLEIDGDGNAYFAGFSLQATFAATAGSFQPALNGNGDGIVGVLNPDASALIWGSYIGGVGREFAHDVARDDDGYVYVTGVTPSDDFPVVNAAQPAKGGTQPDGFVARIMPDGSALMYSTYLGGDGGGQGEIAFGIAADDNGNAYVTGMTNSDDFPTTAGAYQGDYAGGQDAFVTKFGPAGAIVYSTFLGGANTDRGAGIEVDSNGNAYVGGLTVSNNFPTVDAVQATHGGGTDAFVSKLNAAGSALIFSTYLGGSNADYIGRTGGNADGGGISIDDDGTIYAVGITESANFPTTNGTFQSNIAGIGVQGGLAGDFDAFVVRLGEGEIGGDVDCSGSANPIDSLKILRADAGLGNPIVAGCPEIGDEALINGVLRIWGDMNCNGSVDPVDSLVLLRFDAGLSINVPAGCPALGEIHTVEPV